jgi:transposase InsO family protein
MLGGNSTFQVIIDSATGYCHVDLAQTKSDYPHLLCNFIEICERSGRTIKALQTDNAKEYQTSWFTNYLTSKGIQQRFSPPHRQDKNGLAERSVGLISDMA